MDLVNQMSQEEQRYVHEDFTSDEELFLYDMLFHENLSKTDIKKLEEVLILLLQKNNDKKAKLDYWKEEQETKAAVTLLVTLCGLTYLNVMLKKVFLYIVNKYIDMSI